MDLGIHTNLLFEPRIRIIMASDSHSPDRDSLELHGNLYTPLKENQR